MKLNIILAYKIMNFGEIWLVNFGPLQNEESGLNYKKDMPVGHEYQKNRPALIIQANNQLRITSVITIMPLTSQKNCHQDDILIKKSEKNGLCYDSVLKVHHIQSFDKARFIRKIGEVDREIMDKVKEYLKKHFGI